MILKSNLRTTTTFDILIVVRRLCITLNTENGNIDPRGQVVNGSGSVAHLFKNLKVSENFR